MTVTGPKLLLTVAVTAAAMMGLLDIYIVNVALGRLAAAFAVDMIDIGWVSLAYMMANIVIMPVTGAFSQRWGFRRYFVGSVSLFTAGSILCGIAWSFPVLVLARAIQGLGGGALIPTGQAILVGRYPREQLDVASTIFGLGAFSAPVLGPSLGGHLIAWLDWRWMFFVNVPIGIAVMLVVWKRLGEPGFQPQRRPIDLPSLGLLAGGLVSLEYVLEQGNTLGWWSSTRVVVLSLLAAVALPLLVWRSLRTAEPLVNLRLFRRRAFAAATIIGFVVDLPATAAWFSLSLFCSVVLDYDALHIGNVLLRGYGINLLLVPACIYVLRVVDARVLIGIGIAVFAFALHQSAGLGLSSSEADLELTLMTRSIGLTMFFVPINVAVMAAVSREEAAEATGLFHLAQELGGSFGVALVTHIIETQGHQAFTSLAQQVSLYRPETWFAWQSIHGATVLAAWARVQLLAAAHGFSAAYMIMAALTVLCLPLVLLLRKSEPASGMPMH